MSFQCYHCVICTPNIQFSVIFTRNWPLFSCFPVDIFKVEHLQSICVTNLALSGNFHSVVMGDYGGGKLKITLNLFSSGGKR